VHVGQREGCLLLASMIRGVTASLTLTGDCMTRAQGQCCGRSVCILSFFHSFICSCLCSSSCPCLFSCLFSCRHLFLLYFNKFYLKSLTVSCFYFVCSPLLFFFMKRLTLSNPFYSISFHSLQPAMMTSCRSGCGRTFK
jgi:hypothetical protein